MFKTGIIGLPGSGKSTLFDLLTESFQEEEHPHVPGKARARTVKVHDPRLPRLWEDYQSKKCTPATLEILDFPAALGSSEDRVGLADLLAPAREMDALIIVLRDFVNPGVPGGEKVDPAAAFTETRSELLLSDLVITEKRLQKLGDKSHKHHFTDEDAKERALLELIKGQLEAERDVSQLGLGQEDLKRLSSFGFLSEKPCLTILSGETGSVPEERLTAMRNVVRGDVIPVAARDELEILRLPEADRPAFLQEYGIRELMRDPIIKALYKVVGLINFFTANDKEVKAWNLRSGLTASQAAGVVHTDFERGFIRAEVVSYDDYLQCGGVKAAKEKGHYRLEGREYIVKDADIIEFRFSV